MICTLHADGGADKRGRREFRTDEESSIPGETKQPDDEVLCSINHIDKLRRLLRRPAKKPVRR